METMQRAAATGARRRSRAIAVVLTGTLLLWQGAALAGAAENDDAGLDGIGAVVAEATDQLDETTGGVLDDVTGGVVGGIDESSPSGAATAEPDSNGNSATAEGDNLEVEAGGQEVVRAGGTDASAGDGESGSGANLLAVLGHQILGTSSEHEGTGWEESTFGTLGFTCVMSDGALCVDLLYGHTWADGESSTADADAAYLCVAGDQTSPDETCQGPVALRVLDSHSRASDSGARQSSEALRLCLGSEDADGVCQGVGVGILEADSSTRGGDEQTSTSLGSLEVQGQEQGPIPYPEGVGPVGDSEVGAGGGAAGDGRDEGVDHPGSGGATADGRVLHIRLLGEEILLFGQSDSAADDDGSSSDATVLALFGHEIIGAHSSSEDGSGRSETGLLRETCSDTEGQACLALLYGQASSTDDDDQGHGSSDTAAGTACLGGSGEATPEGVCDGPVGATVLDTHSRSDRDKLNNSADAYESSNGATLCLGGENEDGVCEGAGVVLLHSESESHARPGSTRADGRSYLIGTDQGGERTAYIDDETVVEVPADCPEGGSLLCLILNQNDTRALASGIGNDVAVIDGDILPGVLGDGENGGDLGQGEVGTTASAADEPNEPPVVKPRGPQERTPTVQADQGSQLPFTGMDTSTVLALALMLLVTGSGILILAARRESQLQ